MERAFVSGADFVGPGAVALWPVAAGGVPVPRRAVRKLVDPGRGAARDSARAGRRGVRGDAARAGERRLYADRPADDDGARLEERDTDDRIRRASGKAGQARDRTSQRLNSIPK